MINVVDVLLVAINWHCRTRTNVSLLHYVSVSDVTNVQVVLLNGTTCRVTWDRPVSYTEELLGYKITYSARGASVALAPKLDILVEHVTEHIIYALRT